MIEVSAPRCVACRAMRPDLEAVSADFAERVARIRLDAYTDLDAARSLGVIGTPTLIGVRDGAIVFRVTGRRSQGELTRLFAALDAGDTAPRTGRLDARLRLGGGLAVATAGVLAGPAWPMFLVGVAIAGVGLAEIVWRT